MTIEQIKEAAPIVAVLLFILSCIFEVSKIKISPWTWLFKQISIVMNKDIEDRLTVIRKEGQETDMKISATLDRVADRLDAIQETVDENETARLRWELLDFSNSIKNGRRHSKDEYFHIMETNQKYHELIEKTGLKNGIIDIEYEYIVQKYREHRDNNDFL